MERATHRLYAVVCWTTLGRLPLIRSAVRATMEGHLIALCRRLDVEPVSVTVLCDRVHLLVRTKPTHSIARLVGALKRGGRESLQSAGEPVRWGAGFAAISVGSREVRRVMRLLAELAEREERREGGRRRLRRRPRGPNTGGSALRPR
ncbi:MAG: transposase [Gemmatimonadota bacterium]